MFGRYTVHDLGYRIILIHLFRLSLLSLFKKSFDWNIYITFGIKLTHDTGTWTFEQAPDPPLKKDIQR